MRASISPTRDAAKSIIKKPQHEVFRWNPAKPGGGTFRIIPLVALDKFSQGGIVRGCSDAGGLFAAPAGYRSMHRAALRDTGLGEEKEFVSLLVVRNRKQLQEKLW